MSVPPPLSLVCMNAAIERCDLRLQGLTVFTEAASGPYIVTPVMAAMAGANVFAITHNTHFGTIEEIQKKTLELACRAGVSGQLEFVESRSADVIRQADIVTNSGHVRPIDASFIQELKPTAVIPLMYEAWEFREDDVDLNACHQRGIAVAGTNERHPAVDVFTFLGGMASKLLSDAGITLRDCRILLLCDNQFLPFVEGGLRREGATVVSTERLPEQASTIDVILVASRPQRTPVIGAPEAQAIARRFPGAVVAQFWGDLDRARLAAVGVPFWPVHNVPAGHMGILPSALGAEPVIRLQCGGLKVGEVMAAASKRGQDAVQAAIDSGFGERLTLSTERTVCG